ncbi:MULTISPECIES: hypothetical protein [Streptacidiphilus]|uniref:HTH luxR-type domain-containing protein n=1 Tax=Streptacidiphilus cavernicola TaxID=3342716 RepID=A0ABV6V0X6_9ACTN|nr:hypothetical protein [Streptacidiphilus jeojiense]
MLEALGLSTAEEAAYSWLLDRGPTAEEEFIERLTGLGPTDGEDGTLATLVAKGLVTRLPGIPRQVTASPPEITLEHLAHARETELHRARRAIVDLQNRYRLSSARDSSHELVEILHGSEAIASRAEVMVSSTRTEFFGIDAPPHHANTSVPNPHELQLLAQGVRCRSIYDSRSLEIPGYLEVVEEMISSGEEARVIDRAPLKLAISDRTFALAPLESDMTKRAGMLFIRKCGLLDALAELFESVWARAIPLNLTGTFDTGYGADGRPGDDDRRLLAMLASGLPDDSISRALGISHRTMQRRLHRLQQQLHAPTRFQLAMQACRRGWL